ASPAVIGTFRVTVTVLVTRSSWWRTRWVTSPRPASAVTERTGPRLAHSSETRCGATSHNPPLSRRHGVLNGLPARRAEPSQTAHPPAHPPVAETSASHALTSAWNRAGTKTSDGTP